MTIFYVNNATELSTALGNAQGGDSIVLSSGNYGVLNLRSKFTSNVTITSADHSAPAEFTSVQVNSAQHVTFDNVLFNYTYTNGDSWLVRPFEIRNSNNITVQNTQVSGDNDQSGYGTGSGLALIDSHHITLENNVIHNWLRGIKVDRVSDLKVVGNDLHSQTGDGMNFAGVQRVLIENNHIHDFNANPASDYHRDMIQFWTYGIREPNSDIQIRGNLLDIGSGAWTQSIFMRNEQVDLGQAGREMHYKNVLIEDNTIYNSHLHGITVGETDNLIIRNNTMLQAGDQTHVSNAGRTGVVVVPRMNVAETSNDVTIENNITSSIHGHNGQSNWNITGNVLVQNTRLAAEGHYSVMFQNPENLQGGGAHSAVAVEGGVIDLTNAGASRVQPENQTNTGGDQTGGDQTGGDQTGGDQTGGDQTGGDQTGGDQTGGDQTGGDQTGGNQTGGDQTGGDQTGGNQTGGDQTGGDQTGGDQTGGDQTGGEPGVGGDVVFKLSDMLQGNNVLQGGTVLHQGSVKMYADRAYANLGRLTELESSPQIAVSITYNRSDVDNGTERLLWNHMKFGLSLQGESLVVHVANTERPFWDGFRIEGLGLNDLNQHNIQVLANQDTNVLKVYVDGKLVLDKNDVDLDFVGAGGNEWGWTLNTPWSDFFKGTVSDLSIGTDLVDMTNKATSNSTQSDTANQLATSTETVLSDENTIDFTTLNGNDDPVAAHAMNTDTVAQSINAGQMKTDNKSQPGDQATVVIDPNGDRMQVVMTDQSNADPHPFNLEVLWAKANEAAQGRAEPAKTAQWSDPIQMFDADHQVDTVVPDADSLF